MRITQHKRNRQTNVGKPLIWFTGDPLESICDRDSPDNQCVLHYLKRCTFDLLHHTDFFLSAISAFLHMQFEIGISQKQALNCFFAPGMDLVEAHTQMTPALAYNLCTDIYGLSVSAISPTNIGLMETAVTLWPSKKWNKVKVNQLHCDCNHAHLVLTHWLVCPCNL